jgi:hypothetical protein
MASVITSFCVFEGNPSAPQCIAHRKTGIEPQLICFVFIGSPTETAINHTPITNFLM